MSIIKIIPASMLLAILFSGLSSCSHDPLEHLYGTWKGKTKIDQDITMIIKPDSTIAIETEEDSVKRVQKGTYQIVDRRIRIVLTSFEVFEGDSVRREKKKAHDEAVFTLTYYNELVLRRGEQVMVLHKGENSP